LICFLHCAGADLIGRERPTNKIDNDDSAAKFFAFLCWLVTVFPEDSIAARRMGFAQGGTTERSAELTILPHSCAAGVWVTGLVLLRIAFSVLSKNLSSATWGKSSINFHPAPGVPFTYLSLGDVVPAHAHPRPHASDVQIGAFQTHIPNSHFGSPALAFSSTKPSCFPQAWSQSKVLTLVDGSYEQTAAFLPSQSICFFLADFGEFQRNSRAAVSGL